MFENFGFFEGVLILLLAFLLLGPEKLPQLFKWIRKLRLWRAQAEAELEQAISELDDRKDSTNKHSQN